YVFFFFFFQAEDGIRDLIVTGVQTCALPISNAQSKQEVLETIATSFLFPKHFGKNYDALYDCLTDLVHKAGAQPGFVIVLEQLPVAQKFDKEGRETLLDVFREAAEFWAERKVAF